MGGFWPRICVVKKGYVRNTHFLLQTPNFWYFSAPSSLFMCCDLLASAFHRLCWLSHIKLRSGRSADLRSLRWYSIERLAGVGYMRVVHRVTQGKMFRFCTWNGRTYSKEVQISGNLNTRGQTNKRNLFPTDLQNLMPHLDVCDPSDC
jgi:hypothetical protein